MHSNESQGTADYVMYASMYSVHMHVSHFHTYELYNNHYNRVQQ